MSYKTWSSRLGLRGQRQRHSQKITANLAAAGKAINYDYDFNRLIGICYPDNTGNNVGYTYGDTSLLGNGLNQVGRILTLTLPDSETITYSYDTGGNLASFAGDKQGTHTAYLQSLLYDKFEQRTRLLLGNGVVTNYTYNDKNRRLTNLLSQGTVAGKFQNLGYKYDSVGNITDLKNDTAIPPANSFGGPTTQHFDYDDLYRLTYAKGNYQFSPGKARDYTLAMAYDNIHNITSKTQTDNVTNAGGNPIPQKATTYDWAYAYLGTQPHAPTHIGSHTFSYDADGNQTGWTDDNNGTRRIIRWDEDNRISEIDDNGEKSNYVYDDRGERVIKLSRQGETVYVNQYYVVRIDRGRLD